MLPVLLDPDLDPAPLVGRTVAIVGYGNQGHAHAANLRDGGISVLVGARHGKSADQARASGFEVVTVSEAASRADVVMLLAPDEVQPQLYEDIAEALRPNAALAFGHGFALHHRLIVPRPDLDVFLAAPVGPGHLLRSHFEKGSGLPCLIAVHQDTSGQCRALARAYVQRLGGGRAGVIETTVKDEVETDLFGEQTVIVGGVAALIKAGFETLTEAGYPEELAYFECAHQMKLLVDLIFARGIAGMREAISNTAKYGDLTRGPRIIDAGVKQRMAEALFEIRSGAFAAEWMNEFRSGRPNLDAMLSEAAQHPIEVVGARLRALTETKT